MSNQDTQVTQDIQDTQEGIVSTPIGTKDQDIDVMDLVDSPIDVPFTR